MLRWMGRRSKEFPLEVDTTGAVGVGERSMKDGAATVGETQTTSEFTLKRALFLPRVVLKPAGDTQNPTTTKATENDTWSENFYLRSDHRFKGQNPLFVDTYKMRSSTSRQSTPTGEKSSSSGYGGSNLYSSSSDQLYTEMKTKIDGVLEQNPHYVKSIQVAKRKNKSTHSSGSSGTLSTIPEGRIDFTIPRPIWPPVGSKNQRIPTTHQEYDSLVDEAVLLYTSLSNHQDLSPQPESLKSEASIKEILLDLFHNVNATIEGKGVLTPEEMLKRVNDRIRDSLEALKHATEEEMRMLCVNLRNSKKVDSVVRAFSHSSSSGNSSQSSPEWSHSRIRTLSTDTEDIYHLPSSSSSGFSDCMFNKDGMTVINNTANNLDVRQLPMFVHDDIASVPNGVRNAMIYGTLCRGGQRGGKAASICAGESGRRDEGVKQSLLKVDDEKPSVWEQYYGVQGAGVSQDTEEIKIDVNYVPKPTDVPIYPGGRPEADFTLDVPRSEMLSKRMKEDKKWRCRCRLLTSFLGLVFFLLSVMAVSLMLTKGRKMFGSMA